MRELRFRVWDNEKKELVYFANDDWDIYGHSGDIMQCIGLQDKNGKDIYEGDRIRLVMPMTGSIYEGMVTYNQETCAFMIDSGHIYLKEILAVPDIEVMEVYNG